jgi:hypothetical protein
MMLYGLVTLLLCIIGAHMVSARHASKRERVINDMIRRDARRVVTFGGGYFVRKRGLVSWRKRNQEG